MTAPDPRADLTARLRLLLDGQDAADVVTIVEAAGWRPDEPPPLPAELVIDDDVWEATKVYAAGWNLRDADARMRAALECYGRRLLARHEQVAPQAELRRWLDSRPVVVRVDGVDYLSVASVRAFADEAGP